ncbi:MAG: SpoIID/LytB domain-containing protein, partial [Candidatus Coatesbacteria bacterium]|nr:SpoIID/LytB domain-containing protein [Candidatus Coatesbacteria bacterium]
SNGEYLTIDGNRYRGYVTISNDSGRLKVINVLPLGWYLASVIGAEMPGYATLEALKAQSVVSRSYLLHRVCAEDAPFPPVCDSVMSQVYKGASTESPLTIQAVQETAGLVLIHEGKPVDACFSASSGGHTASAGDVWTEEVPYLSGKDDPFSAGGEYGEWSFEISTDECEELIKKAGYNIGELRDILIMRPDSSGRASRLVLCGSKGNALVRGTDLRMLLGSRRLRSTMFAISRTPSGYKFEGRGYGHGVGLSQEGACRMARAGRSCEQILEFYFTGVKLEIFIGEIGR